jgi:hypothetical protein
VTVLVFVTVDGATVVVGVTVTVLTLGVPVSVGVSVAAGGTGVSVMVCGACVITVVSWPRCVGVADELGVGAALADVVAGALGVVVEAVFGDELVTFTSPTMTAASTTTAMTPAITNAAVVRYEGARGGGGGGSVGGVYLAACVGSE